MGAEEEEPAAAWAWAWWMDRTADGLFGVSLLVLVVGGGGGEGCGCVPGRASEVKRVSKERVRGLIPARIICSEREDASRVRPRLMRPWRRTWAGRRREAGGRVLLLRMW